MGNSRKMKGLTFSVCVRGRGVTNCYYKDDGGKKFGVRKKIYPAFFQITISCLILLFYTLNNVVLV